MLKFSTQKEVILPIFCVSMDSDKGDLCFAVFFGGDNTSFLFGQQNISLENSVTGKAVGTKDI